jgi:hypothetical protein
MAKKKPRVQSHSHAMNFGGSPLDGLPQYARIAAWVGIPSAAMIFLLWWTTMGNPDHLQLKAMEIDLKQHVANESTAIGQTWQLISTLERVCLNTSKTDADRIACVVVTQGGR